MKTEGDTEDLQLLLIESFDYIASPPIRIVAGDVNAAHADFFVHESLISSRSEYIANTLRGYGSGSRDQRAVALPDCDPDVVSQYIKLLYTDRLPPRDSAVQGSTAPDKYLVLSKLYVLAHKLLDVVTKTMALDALYTCGLERTDEGVHRQPGLSTVRTIYGSSLIGGDPARKWLVDLYTTHIGGEAAFEMFPFAKDFPQEFLADLVSSMITFRPLPTQLTTLKHQSGQMEAKLKHQFAQNEEKLRERLTQAEEQLKKQTDVCESVKKGFKTVNNQKLAVEDELKQARAEVALLKRRPDSTSSTYRAPDSYRNR
ncbi:hypothetical protein E8E12_007776 [Didymella heteroderae]|uniref:BTB domain-containing protein n=1 Tax=Didymella heteroderae TaxID=1769908 RepID=A0A9P4X1K8_9PLEO|nr:hypothetical protein E8E12_007776 [Didymella heteroderae]